MGVLERVNKAVATVGTTRAKVQSRDAGMDPLSLDDWAAFFTYAGLGYPLIQTTMGGVDRERIPVTSIVAMETNTAVFSLVAARVQAFSQVRFQWTRFSGAVPGDLFYSKELDVIEHPWPNGDTMGLLARMEIDNSIAGNAYIVRPRKDRLARLRPDRVSIVLGSQMNEDVPTDAPDIEVAGYYYLPRNGRGIIFLPDEIAHYCVDEETEILTGSGWKNFGELSPGEETLTLNHWTGLAEWQPIDGVVEYPRRMREMVLMEGQQHSSLTTLDHRWPVERKNSRAGCYVRRMATSATLSSGDKIPLAAFGADLPTEPKFVDALVEAVAWFWTEGCLDRRKDGSYRRSCSISQSDSTNPDGVQRIRRVLRELFGPPLATKKASHSQARWHEDKPRANGVIVFRLNGAAADVLTAQAPGKVVATSFLRSLTQAQLDLFISVSMMADRSRPAHLARSGLVAGGRLMQSNRTGGAARAEQFALACILAGHAVTIRPAAKGTMTSVSFLANRHLWPQESSPGRRPRFQVRRVVHDGRVWCPQTKNQTWLARRRGTVYFTGNCPMPDPVFQFLGMSWMTPAIREIQGDSLATEHKARFFENAADLSVSSLLLTPTGWIRMGDVKLGDRVIGSDGKPHRVSGVFPQGEKDIYQVSFSDGATVECSYDHLWHVQSRYDRQRDTHRVLSLRDLVEGDGEYGPGHSWHGGLMHDAEKPVAKWSVPLVDPVEFDDPGPMPSTDPYRMGQMLGGRSSNLERRIPQVYLYASVTERVNLLRGLLDAGGSVTVRQPNLVRASCNSESLSRDIAELVGGLGGIAHVVRLNRPRANRQWQVTIKRLPEWITPFRDKAKAARYVPPSGRAGRWRYITGVERAGRGETQCIRVDSPDNLYVTDGYVLTHNTPNLAIKFDPSIPIDMVKQFKALMENEHKGALNAYKCVAPETPVTMWDGRQIRADQVRPGDVVAAWSSEVEPGVVTRSEPQPAAPIITVTTQRGRVLRTTGQHPYLARTVAKIHASGVVARTGEKWVNAADLVKGDLVRVGLGWARNTGKHDVVTPEQAWVLGALTGDGSLTTSTPVFTTLDAGVKARMMRSYSLSPARQRPTMPGTRGYRVLGVRALCVQMGMLGKRAWEKRVPAPVMAGSQKVQAAFLSGLIDTDGHVSDPSARRSAEIGVTSTSLGLLRDVQHLLAGLGINASVSTPPSMAADRPGEGLHRHQGHRLAVHGNDQAAILHDVLDLACGHRARRLARYASRPSRQRRSLYDRVVSVSVGPAEATIGIEVAEHHTHITAGLVSHNTLYLGGGADPVTVGKDFQQLDFAVTQGKGESRLAAAAGVPASWVGFSEGLAGSSLNAGNFNSQRRRFSDGTLWHLWTCAANALGSVVAPPPGATLWFDTRGIPILREDAGDVATIQQQEATTITTLVREGFTPESVVAAVQNNDWTLLKHSGYVSVQLQPSGPGLPMPGAPVSVPANGNGKAPANGKAPPNGKVVRPASKADVMGVPGGAEYLGPAGGAKLSHGEVSYRPGTSAGQCSGCVHYEGISATQLGHCDIVADPVSWDGVCDRFEKAAEQSGKAVTPALNPAGAPQIWPKPGKQNVLPAWADDIPKSGAV